ncbi:cytochrome P450 [Actinosynnema pretiosum]|uniref:Cytochrome n=1 Tax=Actinosynnema pretiosum TaxID=42197 RepID=A0A290Z3Y1_9PSEU|nr:cytochrome P450 [Actinosynnema pretiosum]ATE53717.1 cytochrome [Actinosynnema pretiosum]
MSSSAPLLTLKTATSLLVLRTSLRARAALGDPVARLLDTSPRWDRNREQERVRAGGRLGRSDLGMRVTASHAVCGQVLRDPAFGVLQPLPPPELPGPRGRLVNPVTDSFLTLNPPDHGRLRRLAAPWFTPRGLRARQESVRRVVDEHLDALAGRERFDLVEDFAARVPVRVIADLLGVPGGDHSAFGRWGSAIISALDGVRSVRQARALEVALAEFEAFLGDLVEHRRREPGDDVVSALAAEPGLSREDLLATTELLLVAGFETTVNLIGNAVLVLLDRPEDRERLVAEEAWAEAVVEEVLRLDPPVRYTLRAPFEPVELAGSRVRPMTPVMLLLAGANRDPEVFAEPDRFLPGRERGREHLAFSSGIHYCLGAGLARMEAVAALRGLFRRFPDLRLAGRVRSRRSGTIRGPVSLPVSTSVGHTIELNKR